VEYRNSNCCGTPAIGVLPTNRKIFASGDELLLVPLNGGPSRRVELDGVTLDAATAGGRVLAGVVKVRPGAMEHEVVAIQGDGVLWRARHPNLMAVALSADGLAAAAGPQGVVIFDARTGRPLHQVPLPGTRFADLAFSRNALLMVAQKTTAGDLQLLGIDARTGRQRWSVALGPTTVPAVQVTGKVIVVSDFRGRVAAVVSPSGVVQDRWTDAQGPVYIAGSRQGEIAVAIGPNVAVRTPTGRVRWRGAIPGTVLGLQLDGPWLAALGTTDQKSNVPDRIWFVRTGQPTAPR
jgi:outer membrane protein assembly factor BamB